MVKYPFDWCWCASSKERRRFSQTMVSEWQTAFVVSHKMPWCALITAVKNYMTWKLQDFFSETKTKTFIFVIEAPRDQDPGLEDYITAWQDRVSQHNTKYARLRPRPQCTSYTFFWSQTGFVLRPTVSDYITGIDVQYMYRIDVRASHYQRNLPLLITLST